MLIVDSSAVIAILFGEPDALACRSALWKAASRRMSAANYVETGTVIAGRHPKGKRKQAMTDLDDFLAMVGIGIAPIDEHLARLALDARLNFGRGFGTRSGLNFGDCFAYALAKRHSAPLLFVGNEFSLTDIEPALAR